MIWQFPNLGALTLVSALDSVAGIDAEYLDGMVMPWPELLGYVEDSAGEVLALCVSVITAIYGAGLRLCAVVKEIDHGIVTILGNDHVTTLPREVSENRRGTVDDISFGNEVIERFVGLVASLQCRSKGKGGGVVQVIGSARNEPIYTKINYLAMDRVFPHSAHYRQNFARRVTPTFRRLTGRPVSAGVPVEIGRGCIKFSANDARNCRWWLSPCVVSAISVHCGQRGREATAH